MWRWTAELLADVLLTAMLARARINRASRRNVWWSDSKAEQDKNRRRFHTYRRRAHSIVNDLVRQALDAATADALR